MRVILEAACKELIVSLCTLFEFKILKQYLSVSCWVYREGKIYVLTWEGHIFMIENKNGRNLKEVMGFFPFPWSFSLKLDIPKTFMTDFCLVCFQNSRLHYLLPDQSHVLICAYIYYKKILQFVYLDVWCSSQFLILLVQHVENSFSWFGNFFIYLMTSSPFHLL